MNSQLVTKEQLIACPWKEIIDECKDKNCRYYRHDILNYINKSDNNSIHIQPLQLLHDICSMILSGNNNGESFVPQWQIDNKRTFLPQDISTDQANELYLFIQYIECNELKSRIADTLWTSKRLKNGHEIAKIAIDSYIKSSKILLALDKKSAISRLKRAVDISVSLGKGGLKEKENALRVCRSSLNTLSKTEIDFHQYKLIEILFRRKHGNIFNLGCLCLDLGERLELEGVNWNLIRQYWMLSSKILKACNEIKLQQYAKKRLAWSFIKHAITSDLEIVKSSLLEDAIQAFRDNNELPKLISLIHKALIKSQESIGSELCPFSSESIDLTNEINNAIQYVSGKNFYEAIIAFCTVSILSSPKEFETAAKDALKKFPLSFMFSGRHINRDGKTIAKTSATIENDQGYNNESMLHYMHHLFNIDCQFIVAGRIEHARRQLLQEHRFTPDDLLPITNYCPFIPSGREFIFARGLSAGFQGDFLVANHLLIPQIENCLRHIIYSRGGITSTINSSGIQQEKTINDLLEDEIIIEALGERVVFSLKALLVEKTGSNFRHNLCHGLLDHDSFYYHSSEFIWWLILRLCCLPLIKENFPLINEWLKKSNVPHE